MENLLIENHHDEYGVPARILASAARRLIEISGEAHKFSEGELAPLAAWIQAYLAENSDLLTLHFTPHGYGFPLTLSYFPMLAKAQSRFSSADYVRFKQDPIAKALSRLEHFNFYIEGNICHPRMTGNMENGLIKIMGSFYSSYTYEALTPFWSWLERYLAEPKPKVRLEFWMDYFNTHTSRRFLEIMNEMAIYRDECAGDVSIYWYSDEANEDMIEHGELYKEDAKLPIELVILETAKWQAMSKV